MLMIEPFRDGSGGLWSRLNLLPRDYFRGRIAELRGYGLQPVLALNDFPQESFLKTCAVLSEKRRDPYTLAHRPRIHNSYNQLQRRGYRCGPATRR